MDIYIYIKLYIYKILRCTHRNTVTIHIESLHIKSIQFSVTVHTIRTSS